MPPKPTCTILPCKKLFIALSLLLLISIYGCNSPRPGWKTISIGKYQLDVPEDFNIEFKRGIDSQPGLLAGKDLKLGFDYGPYSDTLMMSKEEFLQKGFWMDGAMLRFLKFDVRRHVDWVKTQATSYRPCTKSDSSFAAGCDLIAACVCDQYKFTLPVYIPQEVKDHVLKKDTIQGYYRRLMYPRQGLPGRTAVYMREANVKDEESGAAILHNSLAIGAHDLNPHQQALALEILLTVRPRK